MTSPRLLALATLLFVGLAAHPSLASALPRYVDEDLGGACSDYDVATRSCGAGTAEAYPAIAAAAAAAAPGDEVVLRAGTYGDAIEPTRSGMAGSPIVFRGHAGETAIVTGVDLGILVDGRSFVTIEDVTIRDVVGWARIVDSDHVVIRRVTMEDATATGTTGGVKIIRSTQIAVLDSSLVDGNDNMTLIESDHNLVSGNVFMTGRHSLLSVRCSDSNVIRGNTFSNADQKAMEIYDCEESASDVPFELDATRRNVIEANVFSLTRGSDQAHDYNGIQYAGQQGIVRRNVFHDNAGGGLNFQVYGDEALHNYDHRAYHNTFVDNACYGVAASDDSSPTYRGSLVRMNVLYRNTGCAGESAQTDIGNPTAVTFVDNAVVDSDPGFEDPDGRDFRLRDGSAMIDAASFLTTVREAGSGTTLPVEDPLYFQDGSGVEGVTGDAIQLEGSTEIAYVVGVSLGDRTLALDRAITFTAGRGVALAYAGSAPDMGAFERGLPDVIPPPIDGGVGPGTDGGGVPGSDGGAPLSDGSVAIDGAMGMGGSGDGCGCRAAGATYPPPPRATFAVLALLALAYVTRRPTAWRTNVE